MEWYLGIVFTTSSFFNTLSSKEHPVFYSIVMLSGILLLAAGFPLLSVAQHVIDLSGKNWTVRNSEGNVSAPASLPSQVHLDLYSAGVIRKLSLLRDCFFDIQILETDMQ